MPAPRSPQRTLPLPRPLPLPRHPLVVVVMVVGPTWGLVLLPLTWGLVLMPLTWGLVLLPLTWGLVLLPLTWGLVLVPLTWGLVLPPLTATAPRVVRCLDTMTRLCPRVRPLPRQRLERTPPATDRRAAPARASVRLVISPRAQPPLSMC